MYHAPLNSGSHLSNNGVEESPPSHRFPNGTSNTEPSPDPHRIFVDLNDCNVGFKTYHPEPVTQNGHRLSGRCELGGVWEWTSTVLEKHVGFQAMDSYPGYTGTVDVDTRCLKHLELLSFADNPSLQPTSSTANITSSSVDLGRPTRASPAARLCTFEFPRSHYIRSFVHSFRYQQTKSLITSFSIHSINWYQRNYPYAWVGARLVRDI